MKSSYTVGELHKPIWKQCADNSGILAKHNSLPQALSLRPKTNQSPIHHSYRTQKHATKLLVCAAPSIFDDIPAWNIEGHYSIEHGSSQYQPIKSDGFSLKLFSYIDRYANRLYATFAFEKLQGIMRLCPLAAVCADTCDEPDEKVHLDRFAECCQLSQLLRPNGTRRMWLMR